MGHEQRRDDYFVRTLITLRLHEHENTLQFVQQLPGIHELNIDEEYGLVLISPKRNLYTIRVSDTVNAEGLISIQPKVEGVYGDTRVAPIKQEKE